LVKENYRLKIGSEKKMLVKKVEFEFPNDKKEEFETWLDTAPEFVERSTYPIEKY